MAWKIKDLTKEEMRMRKIMGPLLFDMMKDEQETENRNQMKTIIDQSGTYYEIEITVEKWGPKEAEEFLSKMPEHQRPKKDWSVSRITQEMNAGRFHFNGDTFVIDENGMEIDGQHRAWAIIKSGKTIPVIVVKGVPSESYISIDGDGVGKSCADFFRFKGIINANSAAASAFLIHRYNNRIEGQMKHTSLVTRESIYDEYLKNAEKIQHYCTMYTPITKFVGSRSVLTAACVLIDGAYGGEFVEQFVTELASGLGDCRALKGLHTAISADNKRPRKMMTPDMRFLSILEAAMILRKQTGKVLIKPAIQKAPTL